MARKPPNWEKTGTVAGFAKGLRKNSDALCVIVIRVNDSVLSLDEKIAPKELRELIDTRLPGLIEDLGKARAEKRPARLVWEDLRE